MIPTNLLTYLRSVQRHAMAEQAMITNIIGIGMGSGGPIWEEETIGPIPCYRVRDERQSGEVVIGGQLVAVTTWKIGVPLGTPVKSTSVIEIEGAIYEITEIVIDQTYESVILIYAKRRE